MVVGLIVLTFLLYVVKCMIIKDIAEVKIVRKKKRGDKMPVKKVKEVDDGDFVL